MLQFDLSTIPVGSVINSATLRVFVDQNAIGSSDADVMTLHRLTESWGEGMSDAGKGGGGSQASPEEATWGYRFYVAPGAGAFRVEWSVAGGTFVPSPSGETFLSSTGPLTFPLSPALVADAQTWLDEPASNAGWIILGNETCDQAAGRLLSRTSSALGNRPELTIVYAPVPEPTTCTMVLAGLAVVGAAAFRRKRRGAGRS